MASVNEIITGDNSSSYTETNFIEHIIMAYHCKLELYESKRICSHIYNSQTNKIFWELKRKLGYNITQIRRKQRVLNQINPRKNLKKKITKLLLQAKNEARYNYATFRDLSHATIRNVIDSSAGLKVWLHYSDNGKQIYQQLETISFGRADEILKEEKRMEKRMEKRQCSRCKYLIKIP